MRIPLQAGLLWLSAGLLGLAASTAAALPTQAAGTWSPPVQLPGACGGGPTAVPTIAVNTAGAQVAAGHYQAPDNTMQAQVCTSTDGQAWSTLFTLGPGVDPSVALAPDGRAVVAWEGGNPLAPTVDATLRPPGGSWAAPIVLSTDFGHPVIGMDRAGDAVIAWAGASGAIYTASLPAGGTWTAPQTLLGSRLAGYHGAFNVDLTVNASGAAIIVWNEYDTAIEAASGTILGGFAAPVAVNPAYTKGLRPRVALNDTGWASLAWSTGIANNAITRSPDGTWSTTTQLTANAGGPADTAIDAAGNAIAIFEQIQQITTGTVTPLYAAWRPAGGTWATPVALTAPTDSATGHVVADPAGTFVIAYTDTATTMVNAFTLPALAPFGQPTAVGPRPLGDLEITAGHAVMICNAQASEEPVS